MLQARPARLPVVDIVDDMPLAVRSCIEGGMPVPDLVLSGGAGPSSGTRGRTSHPSSVDHRLLPALRGLTYQNATDSALGQFTARRWDQACGPKRLGMMIQAAKTLAPLVRRRNLRRGWSYGALGAAAVGCWVGHWGTRAWAGEQPCESQCMLHG